MAFMTERLWRCHVSANQAKSIKKLIDNHAPNGLVADLSTPYLRVRPAFVYIKRRQEDVRFFMDTKACWLHSLDEVVSPT
ncbi:hypothetical protein [Candidatus Phycosocius spiralis]|uniref:Uncharacterized protein n=1 Tax=Candidatus Phycosocius spiralis TaxID=2815099 RepID=A0ABQ4PV63_9PROT|nr:hypothetical protein [Candidatus Phycosocius spiralis]GIU66878.1 hypothetical protein PsB1_1032 [Candidatus Phycosocius spiralis]